jgi:predicted Zn-dependent protease
VYQPVIALAEFAVKGPPPPEPEQQRHELLRTLGAALYRAGLTQEAIDRLNEAIAADKDRSVVQDWLFLALAHHHLGHAAEAAHVVTASTDRTVRVWDVHTARGSNSRATKPHRNRFIDAVLRNERGHSPSSSERE